MKFDLFLSRRTFRVHGDDELSEINVIKAGVSQNSILAATLYYIYSADIPHSNLTGVATFYDGTCIASSDPDIIYASTINIRSYLNNLQN